MEESKKAKDEKGKSKLEVEIHDDPFDFPLEKKEKFLTEASPSDIPNLPISPTRIKSHRSKLESY